MSEAELLPVIWAAIIAGGVFMYVLLDGFDLGVGMLFLTHPDKGARDTMMTAVAPYWDGNETWLVIGGAGLLAAFPRAYGIILPAAYLPMTVMLIALIFRGVAFEFRFKAERSQFLWDIAFCVGSTVAAFAQGVVLGAFVQGIKVEQGAYAGGAFDWLTPFSLLVGFALLPGYVLLGACWLYGKTEGALREHARHAARFALVGVMAAMGVISLWMVAFHPDVRTRWFAMPNILFLAPVPLATLAVAGLLWRSLGKGPDNRPFLYAISLFGLGYLGLGVSRWPFVVPPSLTIWEAAAAPRTLAFTLVGAAICLPAVLGYTAYVYRVFRGKVGSSHGYH